MIFCIEEVGEVDEIIVFLGECILYFFIMIEIMVMLILLGLVIF